MKKIQYIIFTAIIVIITACEGYMTELPPSSIISDNAIIDEKSASVSLNGIYSYLGANGELVVYQIVDNAVRSNFIVPNTGTLRGTYEFELQAFNVASHWATLKNLWVGCFKIVNAANIFISKVDALPDEAFSTDKKRNMLGEARFLRAWVNLYQMKIFCHFWDLESEYGPIIRTEPSGLSSNHIARSSVSHGYDNIIEDLEYAAENCPNFYSVYRASKGLAKAYLIETLLMRGASGDYAKAALLADDVISTSGRTLNTTFAGIYSQKWTSPELMFSRAVYAIDPAELGGMRPTIYSLLPIGGRNNPTDKYLSFFVPGDPRKDVIIGTVVTVAPATPATYTNTWLKHFVADSDVPMRYMRLTQVYLFKAEALAKLNAPASQVLNPINILRARSGLAPYSTTNSYSQSQLLDIIFSELVIEIGVENGSEFFAGIRIRDNAGNRKIKSLNDAFVSDKTIALPIPDDELKFNPLIKQNPY
jgi:starch-binding outer membrane protein, SusD/RagB family